MKNVIILHGIDDTPKSYWIPYAKQNLEAKGYSVWAPQLPQADNPQLSVQVPFLLENGTFTEKTIVIGHSSAVALLFGVLEKIQKKIKLMISVSGFITAEGPRSGITGIIKEFEWKVIKLHCQEFIFINSDNDPWGANDVQGRMMFDILGGTLIIRHGEGHMGSDSYNQPYKEFPLLIKLID